VTVGENATTTAPPVSRTATTSTSAFRLRTRSAATAPTRVPTRPSVPYRAAIQMVTCVSATPLPLSGASASANPAP
jgi:hypothetical protein